MPAQHETQLLMQKAFAQMAAGGEFRLPLELCYIDTGRLALNAPPKYERFSLYPPESPYYGMEEKLYDMPALKRALQKIHETVPLDDTGEFIKSPHEQWYDIVNSEAYPYGRLDDAVLANNIRLLAPLMSGANVLSLGVGMGTKESRLWQHILDSHAELPKRVFYNDLMKHDIKLAIYEACTRKKLLLPDNTFQVPGDLFERQTYISSQEKIRRLGSNGDILKFLYDDKAPTVVTNFGVWWNDLSFDQMENLLKFFHDEFKPGTIFQISIDCTTDIGEIKGAYDNHMFRQMFLTAYTHAMWEMNIPVDPEGLQCHVMVCQEPDRIVIQPVIITPDAYLLPDMPGCVITPGAHQFHAIFKLPYHNTDSATGWQRTQPAKLAALFEQQIMQVLGRLHAPSTKKPENLLEVGEIEPSIYDRFDLSHFILARKDSPPLRRLLSRDP